MKPWHVVLLLVLVLPLFLSGCAGRTLAEEKNLLEGVQLIVDGPVETLEKIADGKIDPSKWDAEDREAYKTECQAARDFLKKEKDRY